MPIRNNLWGTMRRGIGALHKKLARHSHKVLTPRELETMKWVRMGKSSWEIAVILDISERTVNFHIANCLKKLDVINRAQEASATANLDTGDPVDHA
jgi:DNA-binding CsgD family transcriptional regulator